MIKCFEDNEAILLKDRYDIPKGEKVNVTLMPTGKFYVSTYEGECIHTDAKVGIDFDWA